MRTAGNQLTGDIRIKHSSAETVIGSTLLRRRSFLRCAMGSGVGMVMGMQLSGFSEASGRYLENVSRQGALESTPSVESTPAGSNVLLVYFSRAGENYSYGDRIDLEVGNTKVLAGMISDLIGCDVYEIEAADPYSDSYDDTVARNVQEQDADARPAIANPLPSIDDYGIVLLGSPIWNVRPPMIMSTFAESFWLHRQDSSSTRDVRSKRNGQYRTRVPGGVPWCDFR